ncbi:pyrophosphatase PpaX [Paenibacillus cellulosilyticus]|uniref:Pyrophosphatase PpaX n=1 Tax=Paenibacillus cellulosilyticus TaxID=375489 RepID=A0A2V2YV76_9BACL|nr:HAD family hydrolase [Paenibacillus cellulosilyticus]PWW05127.1 pyrophosphatase PpaX [Paenibacillus cellulosilyticus]QKS48675.1 HAD family hydrolase [Paenibacillus cellulosilyticus]
MVTIVLWDLDGTIQDSETLGLAGTRHGFEQVLGRIPTEEEYAQLMGRPVPVVYREWFEEELVQQILAAGNEYYLEREDEIICYSGVPEMLAVLKQRGYRMGIVTSKPLVYALGELKAKGLDGLFEVMVAQEDTDRHKPHPDPLLEAVRRLNAAPEECVYIGDQPSDIRAAHAAQMRSIAALWGEGTLERVAPTDPTRVAYEPMDIVKLMDELSNCLETSDTLVVKKL